MWRRAALAVFFLVHLSADEGVGGQVDHAAIVRDGQPRWAYRGIQHAERTKSDARLVVPNDSVADPDEDMKLQFSAAIRSIRYGCLEFIRSISPSESIGIGHIWEDQFTENNWCSAQSPFEALPRSSISSGPCLAMAAEQIAQGSPRLNSR